MLGILLINPSYDAMFLKGLREGGVPIKVLSFSISSLHGIHSSSLPVTHPTLI